MTAPPSWPWSRPRPTGSDNESPVPWQLLSLEQLEEHARRAAATSAVETGPGRDLLLPRLTENERRLGATIRRCAAMITARQAITPAAEWLLDNQHLIEQQISVARRHLPRGFSRALPRLLQGPLAGYPRVYQLALEVIAHVDGRVDVENLTRFVRAWQQTTPLTLGELWAVPIMLRLALIENLRRVASRTDRAMGDREQARVWADRIVAAERDPRALLLAAADMARDNPPLTNAFVAELVKRLQEKGGLVDIPLTWIEHQLAASGSSLHNRVQAESGDQAGNQIGVSASVGSLRFLGTMVWRDFVESMSHVETILRTDPAGVYGAMDFGTRDRYRHMVEDLAREAGVAEMEVANAAIALANADVSAEEEDGRTRHVGYYLVDAGLNALLDALPTLPLRFRLRRLWGPTAWRLAYFSSILAVTAGSVAALLLMLPGLGLLGSIAVAAAVVIAASPLGVAAANWMATTWHPPVVLPRLDLSEGIPDRWRTIVVVPTMLTSLAGVESILAGLEMRYLGNRSPNLHFALLTDFADAPTATTKDDDALLDALCAGMTALIVRHGDSSRFFLFHRAREWNPIDAVWMGYERKRGKLEALNRVLRGRDRRPGGAEPDFSRVVGEVEALRGVAFVITLDTDTRLPRDAAHKLIGSLAHPLNRPCYDATLQRIVAGYAILQPRVAIDLPSTQRSDYVRLYAGEAGTDPYTLAVSDVYQDLFGEGSFVGKGIYDVDAFMGALETRLPDNLILSHDLIEGCFARSGLVTDVLLYEDHPSSFLVDGARRRRWTRGDWQIAFWVLPWVPLPNGGWQRNPLTPLSRWKIVDNLRRSLVPVSMLATTAAGLLLLPQPGLVVVAVLAFIFAPAVLASLLSVLRRPSDATLGAHLRFEGRAAAARIAHAAAALAFLPEAFRNSVDAIARVGVRLGLTGRLLLEWRGANSTPRHGARAFVQAMGTGPLLALGLVLLRRLLWGGFDAASLILELPWAASPFIAAWLSMEREARPRRLPAEDQAALRRLARKTWGFFETFAGPEDHWLPPDNFQEIPVPVTAHRTSPTNIGLGLLASLAAHDFGYVSTRRLLERTQQTLATLQSLDRFRGHFYNWYDTQTLQPLPPLYVSTVDSGNLMGNLLVLESGLRSLGDAPVVSPRAWEALADTLDILGEAAPALVSPLAPLRARLLAAPPTLGAAWELAQLIDETLRPVFERHTGDEVDRAAWISTLLAQVEDTVTGPLAALGSWARVATDPSGEAPAGLGAQAPIPTLRLLADAAIDQVAAHRIQAEGPDRLAALREASERARALLATAETLAHDVAALNAMELDFLYEPARKLFSIGYSVVDRRCDVGCYDLLASEARLISFLAVAQGAVPQEHWFALGRLVSTWGGDAVLLSWSGSMFEYLMPQLLMPSFAGTLLEQSCRAAVGRQIEYGQQLGTPWGVSESGYNLTDAQSNYQYKAFGVPGLGLKRGLGEDQVIAPYASLLALMVAPTAACANLRRMRAEGFEGRYGFFEAIDYTPRRRAPGAGFAVVQSYMAHHQGMGLLAMASVLLDQPMQRRFRAHSSLRASELLLHERVPRQAVRLPHPHETAHATSGDAEAAPQLFVLTTASTPRPAVHLLSNGRYHVMITNAGGGQSRWKDLALTRWREDPTRDDWGSFLYVRDVDGGHRWSATHQPTGATAQHYEAIFAQSRAEFRRRDRGIDLHTEIAVSPEDDVELRRTTVTNLGSTTRTLELTTYAEVVLAPQAADLSHPAFSNLFVQTEVLASRNAILCHRRPRTDEALTPVLFHLVTVQGTTEGAMEFETDRRTFIGRGRTTANPAGKVTGTSGSVLDPIVAVRCRLRLAPEQSVRVHVVTGVAPSRDEALVLIDAYLDRHMADRLFELAATHRQVALRQSGMLESEAEDYLRMMSPLLFADPAHRAQPGVLAKNRRTQSGLWAYGISGDLPIVLLRVASLESIGLVRRLVQAHALWRGLGLSVDLVIWDETEGGYQNSVLEQILSVISTGPGTQLLDTSGGIFLRRLQDFAAEDRILLQAVARLILTGGGGTLAEQLAPRRRGPPLPPLLGASPMSPPVAFEQQAGEEEPPGFVDEGRAYRIVTSPVRPTPAPWSNILANPHFGTLVTESGSAYTWCENAHEFRLTPWDDDPVSDRCGEAFYLRDEDTGVFWSPTPLPVHSATPHTCIHGFGASTFSHINQGIASELTVFVAIDAPTKIVLLRLSNRTKRTRRLTATGYCEWVLGESRPQSLMHVATEQDPTSGALLARNRYHAEFGERIAFFDVSERHRTFTGDRAEFLGRNGSPHGPPRSGGSVCRGGWAPGSTPARP